MTVGTGIFLSSLLLALVALFAVTKDRWNWKRIAKWGLLLPLALVAILVAAFLGREKWANRPTPQSAFEGISLSSTPADVKFVKGAPASTDGPDRWVYNAGSGTAGVEAAQYLIQFKDGRVRFILYTASESQIFNPSLLGFTIGASYEEVVEKLGAPTNVATSTDDLDRIYSYDTLNVFFSFRQGKAVAYGLYRPEQGPMKFRNAAASAPR